MVDFFVATGRESQYNGEKGGITLQDQMLEQEREDAEEVSQVPETECEPDIEPQPVQRREKRRPNKLVMTLSLALCVTLAAVGYLGFRLHGLRGQVEQLKHSAVAKTTIQALVSQYGLTTAFIQQMFPQEYVYMGENGVTIVPFNEALTRHSYDWSGLSEAGGRYGYTAPDGTQALLGVDVSTFSGEIDWEAVKADGIHFAMIRLGFRGYGDEGKLMMDEQFLANVQGAAEAGLDVGVYFFSQAITVEEAEEEAEYVLNALKGHSITYPVVFDLEKIGYDTARTDDLSVEMATQITQTFCERVAQAGYHPMIYGNTPWLMDRIDLTQLTEYQLWLAQYQQTPTFPYQFHMWQYSHQGTVAGIEGSVDMNLLLTPFE